MWRAEKLKPELQNLIQDHQKLFEVFYNGIYEDEDSMLGGERREELPRLAISRIGYLR